MPGGPPGHKYLGRTLSESDIKPGSHMPPSYLQNSCQYCLRHRSYMRTEVAGNCGKDLQRFLLLAVLCPHVGIILQAVLVAMSQVLQWHMRIRL